MDPAEIDAGDAPTGTTAGDAKTVSGEIAMDVGTGYTETLAAFMRANTADAEVKAAQDAQKAVADDAAQAVKDAAQKRVTDALDAQTKAHNALYAVGEGPINMAGIAEWRAKGALEMAIAGWNTAVDMAGMALTTVNATNNANYVPLAQTNNTAGNILSIFDADGNINLANMFDYADHDGTNNASQDSMTGVITGGRNFDAAGNLLVPMTVNDGPDAMSGTDDDFLEPTKAPALYEAVKMNLDNVNEVVKQLEEFEADNQNTLIGDELSQAIVRAKQEQAYYQGQFDMMIADATDLRTDAELTAQYNDTDNSGTIEPDERTPDNEVENITDANRTAVYSLKSRHDALVATETARDNAGVTLTSALTTREMATTAVRTAFTSPQDFYQQLVDRRTYTKNQADAEEMRLAGLTGDDAPTQAETDAAAKAAEDAATALTEAENIQASFQGMLAEDSPVRDLVLETLKPDSGMGQGDDGQALVDAIVGVNDTANAAKTAADETASMIEGLTGDDGEVSMNTTRSMQNESDIEMLDGRVTQNETDIETNRGMIMTNTESIATNAGNIATNAANIMTNTMEIGYGDDGMSRIDHNEARSMQNAEDIEMNAGNIMMNRGMIESNAADISSNAGAIASNMSSIGENRSSIMRNADMIGGLQDQMEVVRAGVAASMALAGMPAINGRGISLGVGSFDGESAFAVGFQIQGEMASFKIGVTSAGGETGASAGVGFQF